MTIPNLESYLRSHSDTEFYLKIDRPNPPLIVPYRLEEEFQECLLEGYKLPGQLYFLRVMEASGANSANVYINLECPYPDGNHYLQFLVNDNTLSDPALPTSDTDGQ